MELLGSDAPRLIHLLARPSVSCVYLKSVNLYLKLKSISFTYIYIHTMWDLQNSTKMQTFQVYI